MNKIWQWIRRAVPDIVFWVPFGFAALLSQQMLADPNNAWVAFYSYFPMVFLFVGGGFIVLVKRIRKLETQLQEKAALS
jgi:hypothetical protein